ncbi:MAG: hypothetical protein QOI10_3107 [Solirubrobacterales bacterium]|jgi:hypothetical protein|nr:hypothetical protein [Solirubrobacterales bacterium]
MTLTRFRPVLATAAVIIAGCVVGGVGFVLGRDSAEPTAAQRVTAVADTQGLADARKRGYRSGFAAGRGAGRSYHEGVVAGRAQGYRHGHERGGYDALGGASFEFAPATFYIVQFAAADGGPELRISDAHQMAPSVGYELCNTNDLCQRTP